MKFSTALAASVLGFLSVATWLYFGASVYSMLQTGNQDAGNVGALAGMLVIAVVTSACALVVARS